MRIMKTLERLEFEYGGKGSFYRTIEGGFVLGLFDKDGNPFTLPEPCGYRVAEEITKDFPKWFDPTPTPVPEPEQEIPAVPETITALQARLVLDSMGALDAVEAFIDKAGGPAKIVWEYATVIERNSPLVEGAAAALGMTSEQMDDLFRAAATL